MATAKPAAELKIEHVDGMVFSKDHAKSFRVQVDRINDEMHFGFVKYFYSRRYKNWYPTKPAFYMPVALWYELGKKSVAITDMIRNATKGMNTLYHFVIFTIQKKR